MVRACGRRCREDEEQTRESALTSDIAAEPLTAEPLAVVDGQAINIATMDDLVEAAVTRLRRGLGFTVATLNLDHLVKRRADPDFCAAYARATFVTADGAPIVWLARRQGRALTRTTGSDCVLPFCARAAREGLPIAIFGASPASLDAAAASLRHRIPALDIRFIEAPPQGFDPMSEAARAAAMRIGASGARLCFVALGAPKQELFADQAASVCPGVGFLGIGAALDFLSGAQKRAPSGLRRWGLEWAWRLAGDPRRLAIRYARCAAVLADVAYLDPLRTRLRSAKGRSR